MVVKKVMNVVIVSEAYPPEYSGAGQGAQFLAHKLNQKNQLFKVITRTKDTFGVLGDSLFIPEEKFFRIVFLQRKLMKFNNKQLLKIIILFLDLPLVFCKTLFFFLKNKNKIDIYFFVSTKWISLVLAFLCRIFNKKYVIETTLMGHDDPFVNNQKRYPLIKNIIKDFQFRNASAVTNISQLLTTQCIKFGLPTQKIFTIPYSVNSDKFHPISVQARKELRNEILGHINMGPIVLFVGVLILRKGIDIVFNAFKLILKEHPNAILIFAGPQGAAGQQNTIEEIKAEIERDGLEKHFVFPGSLKNIEVYFRMADIFFFPSREEGFGRVFIEAMACGTPVVAKSLPGITDYIFKDGQNGIIIDSEDPNTFALAIMELLKKKDLARKLIQNALMTVKSRFSEEVIFKEYQRLIMYVLMDYQESKLK